MRCGASMGHLAATCSSATVRCGSSAHSLTRTPGSPCPRETGRRQPVAAIERTEASVKRHPLLLLALGLLVAGAVVVLIVNLRPPPQMGADEAVFNTVDALFTAVTARDEKL